MDKDRNSITAEIGQLYRVKIVGIDRGPFPMCPDDQGVVCEFLEWMREMEIFSSFGGGQVGGGVYIGYHYPKNVEKIRRWLSNHPKIKIVD